MHAKPISYLPNKNISFQLVLRIIRLGDHSVRANPTASKDIFPCCILLIYLSCEAQNPRPVWAGCFELTCYSRSGSVPSPRTANGNVQRYLPLPISHSPQVLRLSVRRRRTDNQNHYMQAGNLFPQFPLRSKIFLTVSAGNMAYRQQSAAGDSRRA